MKKTVLFLFITIFLVMLPVLVGGRIFANGDLFNLIYPNFGFYHQSLVTGESFLWNPEILSGLPFFSSFIGLFSPLNLVLFKYLPTLTAYHWAIFINVFFAAFFTALLLKEFGLSFWAQVLGGLTFVFSQWFIVADLGIVTSFPILPLIFLLIWEARGKSWPVFVGGLTLGYMFLSAHYNWQIMILAAAFLFAILEGKKTFLKFVVMNLIGLLLGFIQLFPAYIYSQFSARDQALTWQAAAVGGLGLFDIPKLFLPYLRLPLVEQAEALMYVGIIPLFLIFLGLAIKGKIPRFFAGLFILAVLTSLKYSPLFWLLNKLPLFANLRGPSRWMFIGFFAGSILAAFALDRLSEIPIKWQKLWSLILIWTSLGVIGISLVLSLALAFWQNEILAFLKQYFAENLYAKTSGLPLEHYYLVIQKIFFEVRQIFSLGNLKFIVSLLFLFIGIMIIFWCLKRREKFAKNFLVTFATANFVAVLIFYHPVIAYDTWYETPQTVQYLGEKQEKIMTFLPGFTVWSKFTVPYGDDLEESLKFQEELLTPNLNTKYQIVSADGYDNLMPRRTAKILALLGSDRATIGEKLSELETLPEEKAKIFAERKFLLDILGANYVLSAYELANSDFKNPREFKVTSYGIPIYVYENPEARPLVYFAEQIKTVKPDEDLAYQELLNVGQNGKETLMECEPCPSTSQAKQGGIYIQTQRNNKLVLRTNTTQEALLVFSQNHLPGWKAYIDGKRVPIYTVNFMFMGIVVAAGVHEILFDYNHLNLLK